MKIIFQTLLLIIVIFIASIIFFDLDIAETSDLLKGEESIDVELASIVKNVDGNDKNYLEIPKNSVFNLMEQSTDKLLEIYGEPTRIDLSFYEYDWWIYPLSNKEYYQFGIKDQKICTIYALGEKAKVYPFFLGQTIQRLFEQIPILPEVVIENENGIYRFEPAENQYYEQPLIYFGDYYAQIYIDKFSERISSIRVLDAQTIIKQQPYELTYIGELTKLNSKTEEELDMINEGLINQIFDFTNLMRHRNGVDELEEDNKLSKVAQQHSEYMSITNHFSHVSNESGELIDRLNKENISYIVTGENIAAHYLDAIEVVEGWLNSKGHRSTLLNEDFTHLGVGVSDFYYTQNFIGRLELNVDTQ